MKLTKFFIQIHDFRFMEEEAQQQASAAKAFYKEFHVTRWSEVKLAERYGAINLTCAFPGIGTW